MQSKEASSIDIPKTYFIN